MKRLIKKAEPIILYHGTNLLSLDEILRTGIAAGIIDGSPWTNTTKTQTFFGTNISAAMYYGDVKWKSMGEKMKDCTVVLEIYFDTDYLKPDNDDDTEARTWEESQQSIQQVATDGSVRAEQIQKLYFYNQNSELITECTPSEFLSTKNEIIKKVYESQINLQHENFQKLSEIEQEIISEMKRIEPIVHKCRTIASYLYYNHKQGEAQSKLNKQYNYIYSIVEKINKLIEQYNEEQFSPIPFVNMEKVKENSKWGMSYQRELEFLIIEWNGTQTITNESPSKIAGVANEIRSAFTDYLYNKNNEQQENIVAFKKRLKNIVR